MFLVFLGKNDGDTESGGYSSTASQSMKLALRRQFKEGVNSIDMHLAHLVNQASASQNNEKCRNGNSPQRHADLRLGDTSMHCKVQQTKTMYK